MDITPPPRALRLSRWTVWLVWVGLVGYVVSKPPRNLFAWDCFGYHLYLPALCIQGDPFVHDETWVEQNRTAHEASGTLYQLTTLPDGKRVIRYPIGQALVWAPWFLIGHGVAATIGAPMDGYSAPYQWAVGAGVLIYLLWGLRALRKILLTVVSDRHAAVTLIIVVLGTNLLGQVRTDLTMPHLVLFAIQCGVVHRTIRWHELHRSKDAVFLGALIGLAALIRPTEIITVLIPLLWGAGAGARPYISGLFRHWRKWLLIGLSILLIGSIQLIYWKGATGHWIIDSYGNPGEGLDLWSPHTRDFMFSFRKGWLLYTPVMLFAMMGVPLLIMRREPGGIAITVVVILYLYVTSSWSCWWYADSFGSRPMVALYGVMGVPLAVFIDRVRSFHGAVNSALMALLSGCMLLNLFQTWQFQNGIIDASRMTQRAYVAVFCRTSVPPGFDDLLLVRRSYTEDQGEPDLSRYRRVWPGKEYTARVPSDVDTLVTDTIHGNTRMAYALGNGVDWTPALHIPFKELTSKDHAWVSAEWYVKSPATSPRLTCVHSFENAHGHYGYHGTDLERTSVKLAQWDTIRTYYLTPEVRSREDVLRMYFWSRDTAHFLVDGPVITVYEPISPQ